MTVIAFETHSKLSTSFQNGAVTNHLKSLLACLTLVSVSTCNLKNFNWECLCKTVTITINCHKLLHFTATNCTLITLQLKFTFLLLLGDNTVSTELALAPAGNFGVCDKLLLLSELSAVTRANFCKNMRLAL